MFTGLVETTGQVTSVDKHFDVWTLSVKTQKVLDGLKVGDSVAIMGVCTTVIEIKGNVFSFQLMQESLDKTIFKDVQQGDIVNVERALVATSRLDGHIVTGHVDGTGIVIEIIPLGRTKIIKFSAPDYILDCIVQKGSVTINGVSLTVVDATDSYFSVSLIPETLSKTTLMSLKTNCLVNIETDILGKYVIRFLSKKQEHKIEKKDLFSSVSDIYEYGW